MKLIQRLEEGSGRTLNGNILKLNGRKNENMKGWKMKDERWKMKDERLGGTTISKMQIA
jgi:hypothetical protein